MNTDDLLHGYLDGDLPQAEADELEARLLSDPALAARLDRLAELRVRLARLDDLEVPAGLEERLAARLRAERDVPSLDARRAAQAGTSRRWSQVALAAAAIVAVAVVTGGVIVNRTGLDSGGGSLAMEESAPAQLESGGDAATAGGAGGSTTAAASAASEAASAPEALDSTALQSRTSPTVRDTQVVLADAAAVRARYGGSGGERADDGEAEGSTAGGAGGAPTDASGEAAPGSDEDGPRRTDLDAPLSYGAPAQCLDAVLPKSGDAAVELVETVRFGGEDAFAFVLDLGESRRAIVVTTAGCDTLVAVDL